MTLKFVLNGIRMNYETAFTLEHIKINTLELYSVFNHSALTNFFT